MSYFKNHAPTSKPLLDIFIGLYGGLQMSYLISLWRIFNKVGMLLLCNGFIATTRWEKVMGHVVTLLVLKLCTGWSL